VKRSGTAEPTEDAHPNKGGSNRRPELTPKPTGFFSDSLDHTTVSHDQKIETYTHHCQLFFIRFPSTTIDQAMPADTAIQLQDQS